MRVANGSTSSFYSPPIVFTTGNVTGLNSYTAIPLANGVTHNGTTINGTSAVTTYSCANWNENGKEVVHSFIHSRGAITVNLVQTGGADVDAFLLSSCGPTNCLLAVDQNAATTPSSQQAGTYYVVVDGYLGAQGGYALTVSSAGGTSCNAPTGISHSNVTASSAQINWTLNSANTNSITLEYSPNQTAWVVQTLPANYYFYNITGLSGSTTYYYRLKRNCTTGGSSPYSSTYSFATPGSGLNCSGAIVLSNGATYNGTTVNGTSAVTTYSCASSWNESGKEVVHSFVHSGGAITVNLAQTGGVDVDAFLLSSCSASNCLLAVDQGAATTQSSQQVGTYYVVVDGFNGVQGGCAHGILIGRRWRGFIQQRDLRRSQPVRRQLLHPNQQHHRRGNNDHQPCRQHYVRLYAGCRRGSRPPCPLLE
ncbi:MAG: fibronectin type III domain-containing protein [Saprospiraceae bacterium]|nr:fibronectin type III domain-containing protein [Saprospiraceae bacterium]